MKTLYIDCGMGAAGDMLAAALTDLFPDKEKILSELNGLGIPGVEYRLSNSVKCGITGLHMDVLVNGREEDEHIHEEHSHEHTHGTHSHTHTGLHEIEHIVWELGLPSKVEKDVFEVYNLLAEAESKVHGVPVTDIHFHEVGTMDAMADIVAVCYLFDKLGADRIVAGPLHVGSGTVKCAHGILPVPAPATTLLLEGIPTYSSEIKGELVTPTGAALLKHFVNDFGTMPTMTSGAVGYGMGKKDFERANCLRIFSGELFDMGLQKKQGESPEDKVLELSCNVDDMTAEEIGFATERLFEGGALDVYTVAIGMKKNRPGTLIRVICSESRKSELVRLIFKHTSTIGVREAVTYRNILNRDLVTADTPYGNVRIKEVTGYGVERKKAEYEDLARIAREKNISLSEARERVSRWIDNN